MANTVGIVIVSHSPDVAKGAAELAWSDAGVVIMVDMGGAETNSEMAIELMPEKRRGRIIVCNGPIVEGAVMAATESSSGAALERVRRAAEELYSR